MFEGGATLMQGTISTNVAPSIAERRRLQLADPTLRRYHLVVAMSNLPHMCAVVLSGWMDSQSVANKQARAPNTGRQTATAHGMRPPGVLISNHSDAARRQAHSPSFVRPSYRRETLNLGEATAPDLVALRDRCRRAIVHNSTQLMSSDSEGARWWRVAGCSSWRRRWGRKIACVLWPP